jgi:endonuclease/exonuclease/phosphatase family metal-dependent hydrolase
MLFRVMTWNIHGMTGGDGRFDPARLAAVIAETGAEVIGLQEVGTLRGLPPGHHDPCEALVIATGMSHAFASTVEGQGYRYGNCILSRFPIAATRSYDLSVPHREPRGCLRADVIVEGGAIHLFNCHLGLSWRERRKQAAQLLSADILRDTALAYPLVLLGDFNSWSNRSAVPLWLRNQLTDCAVHHHEGPTFPARFPLLRLDRVYVDAAFSVVDCRVHDSALARRASDHLPVTADLELDPRAPRPPPARPIDTTGVVTLVTDEE